MRRRNKQNRNSRHGGVLVLSALLIVALLGLTAFAIDIGYLCVAKSQAQRSADAAVLAGAWELIDENVAAGGTSAATLETNARALASQYAGLNEVCGDAPALASSDIEVGYIANPFDRSSPMVFNQPANNNAVRVRVRRTSSQNGEVSLFFARALGTNSHSVEAEATAVLMGNFSGFRAPGGGSGNLDLLPFALDEVTWNAMLAGGGSDDWNWNDQASTITAGTDGVREVNLFPQGTGSPGNRGTVDIGSSNNSTNDIARQIVYGVSPSDFAYHGGSLEFDQNGELMLNADTGISAGVKDELASIKGQPRIIPIFSQVSGNGNNAMYTIVKFVGVRILDVKLTGNMNSKRVIIQPAKFVSGGGIPNTSATQTTSYIYSPVWLLR
jgi:Flp pilus assembly protein TadG